jgi:uncharacterized protein YjbI with pentapeptide repeats
MGSGTVNWDAVGVLSGLLGAIGQVAIAAIAVYIAYRQWLDSKHDALEQKELTERIERNNLAAMQEQERIIRSQSLDAYFEGIANLLLTDENPSTTAQRFAKGRTDALLKILKPDEKRNLVAFLYGSGLITLNGAGDTPLISLAESDLSEADLRSATLHDAGLNATNFRSADLRGADLSNAYLRGADLRGANLRGADLSPANLHGAILSEADLSEADLSEADLSGADLRGANLSGSYLSGADLRGANLRSANLSTTHLGGANLSGAYLSEVNLRGANLSGTQLTSLVSISGADFTDVVDLSEKTRAYLCSIAAGTHPTTHRGTRSSLNCSSG